MRQQAEISLYVHCITALARSGSFRNWILQARYRVPYILACPADQSIRITVIRDHRWAMLPTPSTSHVDFDKIYEPSEDSYLLLDTLASPAEAAFLTNRFGTGDNPTNTTPLIVEIGIGSGVVLAFITAHAKEIFGRQGVLAIGTDVNLFACKAARQTVLHACTEVDKQVHFVESSSPSSDYKAVSDTIAADLTSSLRPGCVDVLLFNPPYVPTPDVSPKATDDLHTVFEDGTSGLDLFARDSHLLSLSYAGGADGMEVTNRLLEQLPVVLSRERGVAYILLCHQNKPKEVMERVQRWGADWSVAMVGYLGKQGGWEKLCVIRIARHLES